MVLFLLTENDTEAVFMPGSDTVAVCAPPYTSRVTEPLESRVVSEASYSSEKRSDTSFTGTPA